MDIEDYNWMDEQDRRLEHWQVADPLIERRNSDSESTRLEDTVTTLLSI